MSNGGTAAPPTPDVEQGSTIDNLRQLREELRTDDHLDLEVPGYKGQLAIRYRALTRQEFKKLATKTDDSDFDGLIQACAGVLIRDGDDWVPWEPEGAPLHFDTLAKWLDLKVASAREAVAAVFCLDVHPLAAANHVAKLVRWMEGSEVDVNEGLLGK